MKKDLVAVVLAGGVGRRLWPLTVNKVSLPLLGKTFFDHAITSILPKEVDRVVIVSNPVNNENLKRTVLAAPYQTVIQKNPDGFGQAILAAESLIRDTRLLVVIADDLVDPSLFAGVMEKSKSENVFGVLPAWKTKQYYPGGYLVLDGEQIRGVEEKPTSGKEPSEYVYLGGCYVSDSNVLMSELKKTTSDKDDIFEKSLSSLMKTQRFVFAQYSGTFIALKYPWHVLSVMGELLKKVVEYRGRNMDVRSNVIIEGPVYIGDNVKIFENTKIVGPCYIGDNTIIGNNNIIRESHIGKNCVTGFSTDITRSYVGDDCWFHTNYIGDSVLEGNIGMGSGAVCANLRLDEREIPSYVKGEKINTGKGKFGVIVGRDVRVGVNASIMPGIKIGSNSFVGSGVVLDKDLPDKSFCMGIPGYTVIPNTRSVSPESRQAYKKKL